MLNLATLAIPYKRRNKNSAQLELMFGLVELELRFGGRGGEGGNPNLFLHILSSLVNVRLHTENWLCNLAGSA